MRFQRDVIFALITNDNVLGETQRILTVVSFTIEHDALTYSYEEVPDITLDICIF